MNSNTQHEKLKKPLKRDELICREVEGEVVIYNSDLESVHALNSTAAIIFQLFDGKHNLSEITDAITERFEIEEQLAWEDISKIVSELEKLKLITYADNNISANNEQ
jgi:methyltransferase-like protein